MLRRETWRGIQRHSAVCPHLSRLLTKIKIKNTRLKFIIEEARTQNGRMNSNWK